MDVAGRYSAIGLGDVALRRPGAGAELPDPPVTEISRPGIGGVLNTELERELSMGRDPEEAAGRQHQTGQERSGGHRPGALCR